MAASKKIAGRDELLAPSLASTISLDCILLLILCVQMSVFYAANNKDALLPVILVSVASSAALGAYAFVAGRQGQDVRHHILACVMTLFMGPAGCLISIVCCTFNYVISKNMDRNFSDWLFNYLYSEDAKEKESDRLYQRIIAGQENSAESVDTEPLADIMELGSIDQKQQALVMAVKYFTPAMAPILQAGLHDQNNLIRVQAAGGIAKLKDLFHKRYSLYEKRLDAGEETPEELQRFAEMCADYAKSGILEPEKKDEVIGNGVKLYERCVERDPDNVELRAALMRMLMIAGRNEKALQLMDEVVAKWSGRPPQALRDTIMELLFSEKRYAKMRELAAKWRSSADPGELDERIVPWANNGHDAEARLWGGA